LTPQVYQENKSFYRPFLYFKRKQMNSSDQPEEYYQLVLLNFYFFSRHLLEKKHTYWQIYKRESLKTNYLFQFVPYCP
jgi:hypothetical protein